MISIDTVYQKVLALANKEQRGYITPQEFNLLANKAQKDILESYFHDLKTAKHKQFSDDNSGSDEVSLIEEKLHPFRRSADISLATVTTNGVLINLSTSVSDIYRLESLLLTGLPVSGATVNQVPPILIAEVSQAEYRELARNPLTKPTNQRPVFYRISGNLLKPVGGDIVGGDYGFNQGSTFSVDYWASPPDPQWAYVIVNSKPLYNSNDSIGFMIHVSDEEALVIRILELSGIALEKQNLHQSAIVDKSNTIQNQSN